MPLFFRIMRHLLPDAIAWRIRENCTRAIERFFAGLAGAPTDARTFADDAYLDLFPSSTRELAAHEHEHGLLPSSDVAERRTALAAAWQATGGQSPAYLQGVVQTAGFDVYIHFWWSSGPPWVARDPRVYTTQPLVGTTQCGEALAQCGEPQARCNNFLQNNPRYIVNETLARRAPPPVPADPAKWPYFLYWGGAAFPDYATVPARRRREFEQLVLQLCPAQQWLVLLVNYTSDPSGEPANVFTNDDGELEIVGW